MKRSMLAQFNKSILVSVVMLFAVIISLYVFIADEAISKLNEEVLIMQAKEVRWILEDIIDNGTDELRIISENPYLKTWMTKGQDQVPNIDDYRDLIDELDFDYFYIASGQHLHYYFTERIEGEFGEFKELQGFNDQISKEDWFQILMGNSRENPYQVNLDMDKDDLNLMNWINYSVFDNEEAVGGIGVSLSYEEVIAKVLDSQLKQVDAYVVDQSGAVQIAKNRKAVHLNSFGKGDDGQTLGNLAGNDSIDLIISTFLEK